MGLLSLSLRQFRCFEAADLQFSPHFNLIYGENASGKTSILEAIFLLGRGRSLRTMRLDTAIQTGADGFKITGRTNTTPAAIITLVREDGLLQARIGGEALKTLAQLATLLPLQLMDSQAHLLISGGPRWRRQFLDWGVFHVEPAFFPAWHRYRRALRQRNAVLQNHSSNREVKSWDAELATTGAAINGFRRQYLSNLMPKALCWAEQALGGSPVSLEYRQGWPEKEDLLSALTSNLDRDQQTGTTQFGPHRADMSIVVEGMPAQERLSRGQEKALAGMLLLAQAALYKDLTGYPCALLLDDLTAELDPKHLGRFVERIEESDAQAFITAIDPPELLRGKANRLFHVEQGKMHQML